MKDVLAVWLHVKKKTVYPRKSIVALHNCFLGVCFVYFILSENKRLFVPFASVATLSFAKSIKCAIIKKPN